MHVRNCESVVVVITSSVVKITFVVTEITLKVAVITYAVVKIIFKELALENLKVITNIIPYKVNMSEKSCW